MIVEGVADEGLAGLWVQANPGVVVQGQATDGLLADGHQGEIQSPVGEEEHLRFQRADDDGQGLAKAVLLIIEFHLAVPRHLCGRQDVVVGQEQPWRDDEAGAETAGLARLGADVNPADETGDGSGHLQKLNAEKVAVADNPLLKQVESRHSLGRVYGLACRSEGFLAEPQVRLDPLPGFDLLQPPGSDLDLVVLALGLA